MQKECSLRLTWFSITSQISSPSVNTWVLSFIPHKLSTGALPLNTSDFTSPSTQQIYTEHEKESILAIAGFHYSYFLGLSVAMDDETIPVIYSLSVFMLLCNHFKQCNNQCEICISGECLPPISVARNLGSFIISRVYCKYAGTMKIFCTFFTFWCQTIE